MDIQWTWVPDDDDFLAWHQPAQLLCIGALNREDNVAKLKGPGLFCR